MITNFAGIPAGYGYFEETSPVGTNIMPSVVASILNKDQNAAPIYIQTMSIQVGADAKVSINGRTPVLVRPDVGLSFDVRGTVNSIVFDTAVQYNLTFSY